MSIVGISDINLKNMKFSSYSKLTFPNKDSALEGKAKEDLIKSVRNTISFSYTFDLCVILNAHDFVKQRALKINKFSST